MPLKTIEKYQYAQMVTDILDKILITSRRGINFVVRALTTIVLHNRRIPKENHIPKAIIDRAQQIRALIEDRDIWIPIDPLQAQDRHYHNRRTQEQREFTNIVKRKVEDKIESLRWMSNPERRELITLHKQKRKQSQQPRKEIAQHPVISNVESDDYVELRNQWRLNLMFPMGEEQGLDENEMSRLACLVDTEKYHWGYAQLLTMNLPLAHWLSKKAINNLILEGTLDMNNEVHAPIMIEPTEEEMKCLDLLSPFLQHGFINVERALQLQLEENDYAFLENKDFRRRAKKLEYTEEDLSFIWGMGISTDSLENKKRRQAKPF
ncbi:MAG: hypothetical protein BGO43_14375 [Gammaproteobacteria bacterium 39-13]|nr:hypothetical protein [Gammaproteobacteria bacterium]OJV95089.1 MAG: hypothetical protein BGO43_14375 [Gammaproteobacteria bacterium 39-13]